VLGHAGEDLLDYFGLGISGDVDLEIEMDIRSND
jgi:hypothetical protein